MRNILYITLAGILALSVVTWRAHWDLSGRSSANDLILLDIQTIRHPDIGGEYLPGTDEIVVPRLTLLHLATRDGREVFFVRGATTEHDARMLFRVRDPEDLQVRFDR